MKNFKATLQGFVCFFLTVGVNVGFGMGLYSLTKNKSKMIIGLLMFLVVFLSAMVCSILDVIRRKIMIEKPLKEITEATEQMAKGNFKIHLVPSHSYKDFDEFDLIKEDLMKMAKELSKSELLKNDFISNVSHEIKTPLSVIQSYAFALNDDKLEVKTRKKYLNNLQNSCKKLSNLVTNILKLNKLENQNLIPEMKKFNLSESLTNQILQYEQIIEDKNLELECDIEQDLYIYSEESYLEIIWNNLISNAIKFTEKGKISVSLKKQKEDIIVKIKDTGKGMTSEIGKHIFDKFYQGDSSHIEEGNGLGLALVKKVIDILGGSISVESELGQGSIFTVVIKER